MRALLVVATLNPGLTVLDVQARLVQFGDWYRISNNAWVVYTAYSAQQVSTSIQPLVEPSGTVLVASMDRTQTYGWMSQEFWNWIRARP